MRERQEIQNELNDGYSGDTLFVPLTAEILEKAHQRSLQRHTRIQTELLLDIRDLLQLQDSRTRTIAAEVVRDVFTKGAYGI